MISILQVLRFTAFLFIFSLHARPYNWFQFPVINAAASSVSFFIILSGFLLGIKIEGRGFSVRDASKYYSRKIQKIYPLYFCTLVFSALYYEGGFWKICSSSSLSDFLRWWEAFIRDVFLVQSWWPVDYYSFNGVAWFLSTIFFMYLVAPLLTNLLIKINRIKKSGLILLLILLGCLAVNVLLCWWLYQENMPVEFWAYVFPPSRLPEFVMGGCVGFIMKRFICNGERTWIEFVCFTIAEAVALCLWIGILYHEFVLDKWAYSSSMWVLPNIVVISVFSLQRGGISRAVHPSLSNMLGRLTMPAFLIHQIVIHLQRAYFTETDVIGCRCAWIYCLACTIFFAYMLSSQTVVQGMSEGCGHNRCSLRMKLGAIIAMIFAAGLFFLTTTPISRSWMELRFKLAENQGFDGRMCRAVNVLYVTSTSPVLSENSRSTICKGNIESGIWYSTYVPADTIGFRLDFRMKTPSSGTNITYPRFDAMVLGEHVIDVSNLVKVVYKNDLFPCFQYKLKK